MPFTMEETRTVQYMIDSYNLSKETYVFSEHNDILFRRLFSDSESSASTKKYDYSSFDVGNLIMTVIKKNVFFVTTIDKAQGSLFTKSLLFQCKNPIKVFGWLLIRMVCDSDLVQFESISVGDKTALLKKNMTEMCHLRGAIRFDVKSNNFVWYFSKKDELQMTFQKSSSRG